MVENKKLWFKARRYGWGWYPISWEGWVVILLYAALITKAVVWADFATYSASDTLLRFMLPFIILTGLLLAICYHKGEALGWHWNNKR